MIIISQVAGLARQIEYDYQERLGAPMKKNRKSRETLYKWSFRGFGSTGVIETEEDEDGLDENILKSMSLQSNGEARGRLQSRSQESIHQELERIRENQTNTNA
jgi:hypothetical protein